MAFKLPTHKCMPFGTGNFPKPEKKYKKKRNIKPFIKVCTYVQYAHLQLSTYTQMCIQKCENWNFDKQI